MKKVEDYTLIKRQIEALKDLQQMSEEDWKEKYINHQDKDKKDTWRI